MIAVGGDKFLKLRATTNIEQKKESGFSAMFNFYRLINNEGSDKWEARAHPGVTPPVFILFSFAFYVG